MMAWLDTSSEEQRRVRELVRLFEDSESRDELGIGQIRDVYSNRLFPGTSVIQTRARYFLFVPWLFQRQERRGKNGPDLYRRVQSEERRLIEKIREAGDERGLIGRVAGANVKILPSTIYWGGLQQLGILTSPLSQDQLGRTKPLVGIEEDERSSRPQSTWQQTIPEPPASFPDIVDGGFTLREVEASWLRDRIASSQADTVLAGLVTHSSAPSPDSDSPWSDPVVRAAASDQKALLDDAHRFSLVMHGAGLLYNLLLAEAYEAAAFDRVSDQREYYRNTLAEWADEMQAHQHLIEAWDVADWWADVRSFNPRLSPLTHAFVTAWIELARTDPGGLADSTAARSLVDRRERFKKKSQSRLANERVLRNWNGASGAEPLVYRWRTVRDLVTDVVVGVRGPVAAA